MTKPKPKESKPTKEHDLLVEMRGLLTNYPKEIEVKSGRDTLSVLENLDITYEILKYCVQKTIKDDIRKQLKEEIKIFEEKIKILEIITLYRVYISSSVRFGIQKAKDKLDCLINENLKLIIEKLQYFLLAIPTKKRRDMHLQTSHGLPASLATEYEQAEIEVGEKIQEGQAFKVEEGEVIPI